VALVTAIVSALTGRRAKGHVAMTGEISLRGLVLPVGGIKGKVFAANRAGITQVVLPTRNEKDLGDIPSDVLDQVDIKLVDRIEAALDLTLEA
jgi:ATP-dependent Lon protease